MERLMALRLGLGAEHTLEEIARAVGRARSRIVEWMRIVREHGVAELLGRHQGRGRTPRVSAAALKGLRHGLRRGRWKRAKEAGAWLRARHAVSLSEAGVRYWLKKAGES
jgi:transposase